jgi:hypothetical protein
MVSKKSWEFILPGAVCCCHLHSTLQSWTMIKMIELCMHLHSIELQLYGAIMWILSTTIKWNQDVWVTDSMHLGKHFGLSCRKNTMSDRYFHMSRLITFWHASHCASPYIIAALVHIFCWVHLPVQRLVIFSQRTCCYRRLACCTFYWSIYLSWSDRPRDRWMLVVAAMQVDEWQGRFCKWQSVAGILASAELSLHSGSMGQWSHIS